MKKITNWFMALAIVATMGGSALTLAVPQSVSAADGCNRGFLGFPAWYNGLTDGNCDIVNPDTVGGLSNFIWRIAINIVEIALMFVGYLSVGFVIYGGFLLMTARGKPADIAEGQLMIRSAVIGLVISFGSVAIINFIVGGVIK